MRTGPDGAPASPNAMRILSLVSRASLLLTLVSASRSRSVLGAIRRSSPAIDHESDSRHYARARARESGTAGFRRSVCAPVGWGPVRYRLSNHSSSIARVKRM